MAGNSQIYLWLDDERRPPHSRWTWVKSVDEAQKLLSAGNVEIASLDHDLGDGAPDGSALVDWMTTTDTWPKQRPVVHSMTKLGGFLYMVKAINAKYGTRKWLDQGSKNFKVW